MKHKQYQLVINSLIVLLMICSIMYLLIGSYSITPIELLNTLIGNGTKLHNLVILNLRLPRLLLGWMVGVALAISGGILQTMTRNPLADPSILGINAGAAFASVIMLSTLPNYYSSLKAFSIFVLPLVAISGAGLAAFLLFKLSDSKFQKPKRLLLMGLGLQAGLNALILLLLFRGGMGDYNRILVWLSGSLWGTGWMYNAAMLPIGFVSLLFLSKRLLKLDVLLLSDEHVVGLGVNIEKERKVIFVLSVVLAGAASAFAGNIGFIGLICPHIARKLVGPYHRYFIPVSVTLAMGLITLADLIARNAFSPIELPVGLLISLLGVPYFVYLLIKE